jgi:hypothetical protein
MKRSDDRENDMQKGETHRAGSVTPFRQHPKALTEHRSEPPLAESFRKTKILGAPEVRTDPRCARFHLPKCEGRKYEHPDIRLKGQESSVKSGAVLLPGTWI